jgi:hypothetical protein
MKRWEIYAETVRSDDPKGWSVRSAVDLHPKICKRCTEADAQRIVDALDMLEALEPATSLHP